MFDRFLAWLIKKAIYHHLLRPLSSKISFYLKVRNFFKPPVFTSVLIETICICNRKCNYCPNSIYDRTKQQGFSQIDEVIYKTIIDKLALMGFKGRVLPHLYGEPLLDSRLPELLSYTREKLPLSLIGIHSNGDLLTEEKFDVLTEAGVDFFIITNHSPHKKHVAELLSVNRFRRIWYRNIESRALYNRGGQIDTGNESQVVSKCKIPEDSLTFDVQGNLILCCNDYKSEYILSNHLNFDRVVNDRLYIERTREISNGAKLFSICRRCKIKDVV